MLIVNSPPLTGGHCKVLYLGRLSPCQYEYWSELKRLASYKHIFNNELFSRKAEDSTFQNIFVNFSLQLSVAGSKPLTFSLWVQCSTTVLPEHNKLALLKAWPAAASFAKNIILVQKLALILNSQSPKKFYFIVLINAIS